MPLEPGTHLGRYEIRSKLGEGGMGVVYRGVDPKLGREVAIKVLSPEYSADADRLARFEREARAAGALSHENVLTVYDTGAHEGAPYIVSELLEGEDLRAKLGRGPLPLRRALDYARQIAAGLAAAHEREIVHRDLKPENVFVTTDGRVKILDFGVAKLAEAAPADADQSSVETRRLATGPGAIVGTPSYMSPEQAAGGRVAHRSDIFSFGCVLYEMFAGRRAFERDNWIDTLSAIRNEEPPEFESADGQPSVPAAVERIGMRCLEKRAERRFQSAGDLAFALETLSGSGTSWRTISAATAPAPGRASWRTRLPWLVAGSALLLAAAAFAPPYFRRAPAGARVVRFAVPLPEKVAFLADVETHNVAVAPDGRRVAFAAVAEGQRRLYLRALDQVGAHPLAGTEGAKSPFWSPDSRYVAFFAEGKLKRVEAAGGPVQTICDVPAQDTTGSWGRDGTILFAYCREDFCGLYRVSAAGGAPAPALKAVKVLPDWVSFLPDGRRFIFYGQARQKESSGLNAGTLGSEEVKLLTAVPHTRVEYAPPGFLLYAREGALLAQPFDADSLRLSGEPAVIVEHMPYFDKTGWAEFSVSETGVLVHAADILTARLVWLDRMGRETGQIGGPNLYGDVRLSPDGQRLAVMINDARTTSADIWIYDLARDSRARFASGPADDSNPVWSPDGRRLAYFSCCEEGKSTLRIKESGDTAGAAASPLDSGFVGPQDWSPDGRFILYTLNDPEVQRDLWALPLDDGGKPVPFAQTEFNEVNARFSPDGHFIAYVSNETGADESYVKRFGGGEKWRVSTAGGTFPRWRRDGRELFYLAADGKLMSVAISGRDTFEAATPAPLFPVGIVWDYDVAADGKRFVAAAGVTQAQYAPFTVVLNWAAELEAVAP